MKMVTYPSVDEYIKSFPKDIQALLNQLRSLIAKTAPSAVEGMSYGMPGYKLNGKPLVYFGGFKNHIGFFPTPNGMEKFNKELAPFKTGRGTAQFPLDKPLPLDLITSIVKYRLEQANK